MGQGRSSGVLIGSTILMSVRKSGPQNQAERSSNSQYVIGCVQDQSSGLNNWRSTYWTVLTPWLLYSCDCDATDMRKMEADPHGGGNAENLDLDLVMDLGPR